MNPGFTPEAEGFVRSSPQPDRRYGVPGGGRGSVKGLPEGMSGQRCPRPAGARRGAGPGHSVEVLLTIYAKCIQGRDQVWLDRIDRSLDGDEI